MWPFGSQDPVSGSEVEKRYGGRMEVNIEALLTHVRTNQGGQHDFLWQT